MLLDKCADVYSFTGNGETASDVTKGIKDCSDTHDENNNSSTSFCLRSRSCRTDLSIHFQPSRPTTIWMFFLELLLHCLLVHSTMRQTTESLKYLSVVDTAVRDFLNWDARWFEPRSLAYPACSTGQSETTYTTVAQVQTGIWSITSHSTRV